MAGAFYRLWFEYSCSQKYSLKIRFFKRVLTELIIAFYFSVKNKKKGRFFICFLQGVFRRVRNRPPGKFYSININLRKKLEQLITFNSVQINSKNESTDVINSVQDVDVTLAG